MRNPLLLTGALSLLTACSGDPDAPGLEYMPDMYRSPAVEAYVDYGQDPYYFADSTVRRQRLTASARYAPEGTIAFADEQSKAAYNFPYPYPDTQEGYDRAGAELRSPVPFTQATVDQGKEIYVKFCTHCHGTTGAGDGAVVSKGGHPPPTAYSGPLKDLSEGRIFHTLTYGKGMMGSHAGQLNKEERWLVTRYVQYLQNGGKMPGAAAADTSATTAQAANGK